MQSPLFCINLNLNSEKFRLDIKNPMPFHSIVCRNENCSFLLNIEDTSLFPYQGFQGFKHICFILLLIQCKCPVYLVQSPETKQTKESRGGRGSLIYQSWWCCLGGLTWLPILTTMPSMSRTYPTFCPHSFSSGSLTDIAPFSTALWNHCPANNSVTFTNHIIFQTSKGKFTLFI